MDINACLEGWEVFAPAAAMAAEPSPDSFVNSPLAIPYLAAERIVLPINPPATAAGSLVDVKADLTIISEC